MEEETIEYVVKKATGTALTGVCAWFVYDLTKTALLAGHDGVILLSAFTIIGLCAGAKIKDMLAAKENVQKAIGG